MGTVPTKGSKKKVKVTGEAGGVSADRKKEAGEGKRLTRESAEQEEAEGESTCDSEGDNQIEKRHKRHRKSASKLDIISQEAVNKSN